MSKWIEEMKNWGRIPFDLKFLRAIGIKVGQDWDGEVLIDYPDDIPKRMRNIIEQFKNVIKKRL